MLTKQNAPEDEGDRGKKNCSEHVDFSTEGSLYHSIETCFLNKFGIDHLFQTFNESSKKGNNLARKFHGSLSQHLVKLEELNRQGAGIFFTVNETDGEGRKTSNITRVRALFIDLDKDGKRKLDTVMQSYAKRLAAILCC